MEKDRDLKEHKEQQAYAMMEEGMSTEEKDEIWKEYTE